MLLGIWLKRRVPILDRLNIPVPIAGGMVFAVIAMALRDRVINFDPDVVLRDLLMVAFMTTVGIGRAAATDPRGRHPGDLAPGALDRRGDRAKPAGNGAGGGDGSGRAAGNPGWSGLAGGRSGDFAGFGPTFEKMGVAGATTAAFASATFGIVAAGLIGGYAGGWLIRRHGLKPAGRHTVRTIAEKESGILLNTVLVIGIAMGIGTLLSGAIEKLGVILPGLYRRDGGCGDHPQSGRSRTDSPASRNRKP